MNITLCGNCDLGKSGFGAVLSAALEKAGLAAQVSVVECMSGCARPSAVAFRMAGKTAYLFGDVTAQDLPGLITFAKLYQHSTDGTFADARPLGSLRTKALARIPG